MNRELLRRSAVAATTLAIACGITTPAAAVTVPDINAWFRSAGPSQVLPYVHNFPTWATQGNSDPTAISFGVAAPTLGYSLPAFDLSAGTVTGPVDLSKALVPTGGYCARVLVNHVPIDIVACADPTPDGTTFQIDSAGEVHFLSTSADLPVSGTTAPDHNFVGVVSGSVVPMDPAAQSWLGASALDGPTFVTLAAQQKAEWAALDTVNGPAVGGDIPLIGGDRTSVLAFEAAVSKASGVPVARLNHQWNAPAGTHTVASSSTPRSNASHLQGWVVPVGSLVGMTGLVLLAVLRRLRNRPI